MVKKTAPVADETFGGYLQQLAADNGYSQADLALAADVNATQLSRAFDNKTIPSVPTLRKLAGPLNVRLGDLIIKAGLATAVELGTVGAAPPPLPPVVRDILTRLDPRAGLTEKERRMLQAAMRRALESFDEWFEEAHNVPIEPRMRARR